jgi:hypothetical protein
MKRFIFAFKHVNNEELENELCPVCRLPLNQCICEEQPEPEPECPDTPDCKVITCTCGTTYCSTHKTHTCYTIGGGEDKCVSCGIRPKSFGSDYCDECKEKEEEEEKCVSCGIRPKSFGSDYCDECKEKEEEEENKDEYCEIHGEKLEDGICRMCEGDVLPLECPHCGTIISNEYVYCEKCCPNIDNHDTLKATPHCSECGHISNIYVGE